MAITGIGSTRPVLRRLFPLALVFLAVGLAMAMSSPFLTLFLSTALRVGPAQVTVFLIVAPLSAVLASTLIGRWSDGRVARRQVLIGAALAAGLGATTMAVVRDYWVLLAVAATVIATGASLQPQLFAYAREAMRGSDRTSMAMSTLRTLFSVAWVAGPRSPPSSSTPVASAPCTRRRPGCTRSPPGWCTGD